MEITLENVDKVIERTGVSYAEAKHALEEKNGDVLEAIIYIEQLNGIASELPNCGKYETIEELKLWLKNLIKKGNVSRIRISKDGKEIVDVPVNAGIAAGVIAIIIPAILAFGVIAAVVTQITIEITRADGSVEVVNKYINKAVEDVKDAASDMAVKVKDKIGETKSENKSINKVKSKIVNEEEKVYSYTINFDEEDEK